MPIRSAPGTRIPYYLIVFDKEGNERPEPDGALLTTAVLARLAGHEAPVTDIFLMSHGWQGDIPGAIGQYDAWIGAMAAAKADLDAARSTSGFEPLIVGLHWPSLPWGDETIPAGPGLLSADDERAQSIEPEVEAYASRIADTPVARAAIRAILDAAQKEPASAPLSQNVRAAYATLFAEIWARGSGPSRRPGRGPGSVRSGGHHQGGRRGTAVFRGPGRARLRRRPEGHRADSASPAFFLEDEGPGAAVRRGRGTRALAPPHAGGAQGKISPDGTQLRLHRRHGVDCRSKKSEPLSRPVDTLFLVQGALSIWAYTDNIPYVPGTAGYFERIMTNRLVSGPIVTTRSRFDRAVGFFYPLGAGSAGQIVLAAEEYPPFGGLGAFGIQGVKDAEDRAMLPLTSAYDFEPGRIYNLEASDVIRNGSGPSGAHSDIAHPEVAHAYWEAVRAGQRPSLERNRVLGGLLGVERAQNLSGGGAQPVPGIRSTLRVTGTIGSAKKGGAKKAPAKTSGKKTAKKAAAEKTAAGKPAKKQAAPKSLRKAATQKNARKSAANKTTAKKARASKPPAKKSAAKKSAAKPKPGGARRGQGAVSRPELAVRPYSRGA